MDISQSPPALFRCWLSCLFIIITNNHSRYLMSISFCVCTYFRGVSIFSSICLSFIYVIYIINYLYNLIFTSQTYFVMLCNLPRQYFLDVSIFPRSLSFVFPYTIEPQALYRINETENCNFYRHLLCHINFRSARPRSENHFTMNVRDHDLNLMNILSILIIFLRIYPCIFRQPGYRTMCKSVIWSYQCYWNKNNTNVYNILAMCS